MKMKKAVRVKQSVKASSDASRLVDILREFTADDIRLALEIVEFPFVLLMASCVCQFLKDKEPALQDPEIAYNVDTEELTITTKVKGTVTARANTKGTVTITGSLQVDIHEPVNKQWNEIRDGMTLEKKELFDCTQATKDIVFSNVTTIKLDAQRITGTQLVLLLEVYWKVEGCASAGVTPVTPVTYGDYRQYRRVGVTIKPGKPSTFESEVKAKPTVTDGEWKDNRPLPGD